MPTSFTFSLPPLPLPRSLPLCQTLNGRDGFPLPLSSFSRQRLWQPLQSLHLKTASVNPSEPLRHQSNPNNFGFQGLIGREQVMFTQPEWSRVGYFFPVRKWYSSHYQSDDDEDMTDEPNCYAMFEDSAKENDKKSAVGRFLDYKMTDFKTVINQVNDLKVILNEIQAEGIFLCESFKVAAVIEKLPPSWGEFKNNLKHKRNEMKLEDLIMQLRMKEDKLGHQAKDYRN